MTVVSSDHQGPERKGWPLFEIIVYQMLERNNGIALISDISEV
jgi:hypothetical protein